MSVKAPLVTIPTEISGNEVLAVTLETLTSGQIRAIVLLASRIGSDRYIVASWDGSPDTWQNGRYFTDAEQASEHYARRVRDVVFDVVCDRESGV